MFSKDTLSKDIFASFVVFLISMPLCLGVAIASGVDPIKGIFTGIIGGVVVGALSGAPLQISGPSPGLAVMVLHIVDTYGPQALIPLGLIVGASQIVTGILKVAHFFQAIPPALLKAMLSGIGALIVMAQIYILFDLPMSSKGLENLAGLPGVFQQVVTGQLLETQMHSGLVGLLVIVILVLWSNGKGQFFEILPGPLVSIAGVSLLVMALGWKIPMVNLPENIFAEMSGLKYGEAFAAMDWSFFLYALGFAFICSTETLLCVSAVDKMAKTTSSYNKQIFALGVGNVVTGLLGAIPVVGVIVRSAANIEFGAKTKLSSILHGVWVGLFLFLPGVLGHIPISALAGLLIYTGVKLLDVRHMWDYVKNYNKTSWIFFVAFALIVSINLLAGVAAGFAVAVMILVFDVLKFDLEIDEKGDNKVIKFKGKLSFLDLPVLSKQLQGQDLEDSSNLEICLSEVEYLDPAISEHLSDLKDKLEAKGKNINIRYSKLNIH